MGNELALILVALAGAIAIGFFFLGRNRTKK
jgi:hypothetical protein